MTACVLFDLDGTLTDPFDGISRCVAHALDELGVAPLSPAQQRAFIGPPLQDSFAALGLSPADGDRAVALYRERFTEVGLFENAVYPGIEDVLDALARRGRTMAVATSKPTAFAVRIVEHFGLAGFFATVSGASLDGTIRAKADVIAHALDVLGLGGSSATMVGDRAQDVLGARVHGLVSVGVGWGYAEPGELEDAGADHVVSSPSELLLLL